MSDLYAGHLYWSDIGSKKISRSSLPDDPGREQVIVDTGLDTVDGLAVDINGRLIYWTGAIILCFSVDVCFSAIIL